MVVHRCPPSRQTVNGGDRRFGTVRLILGGNRLFKRPNIPPRGSRHTAHGPDVLQVVVGHETVDIVARERAVPPRHLVELRVDADMHLLRLNDVEILEHIVLHRARQLLDRAVEDKERVLAHPIGHAVDVRRGVRADTAAIRPKLLKSEGVGRTQILLAMERGIRPNQDLTSRSHCRDDLIAVREPLSAGRVRGRLCEGVDVLLRRKAHKHRILRVRRTDRALCAKTDQMPIRR